jgi:UDP:flavonoid glycosyltransferase YjiC (YdhE family)
MSVPSLGYLLTPSPHQVKEAVQQILTQPKYKSKAKFFQAQISQFDTVTWSVDLLEKLANTKQPILSANWDQNTG